MSINGRKMRQAVPTEVVSTEVGLKRVRFAKPWSNEKPGFESKADDTSDGIKSIRNWSKELQPWGEKPVYLSNKVSYSNNDSSPLHLTLAKRLRSDDSVYFGHCCNCQNVYWFPSPYIYPVKVCVERRRGGREGDCVYNLSHYSLGAIYLVGDRISHWPENPLVYGMLCWLTHEPQGCPCPHFPHSGIVGAHHPSLLLG